MATSAMNKILSTSGYMNTATPTKSFDFSKCLSFMFIPKGKKLTKAECLTMYTTLNALAQNNTESLRGYPIQDMLGIENKSDDVTINSASNFGGKALGAPGSIHYLWKYTKGGMNREALLATFVDRQDEFDVILFDEVKQTVVMTKSTSSSYEAQGFSLDLIYQGVPKISDGSADTEHYLGLCFSDIMEFRNIAYYPLPKSAASPQSTKDIKGLNNLELYEEVALAGTTTGTVKIAISTAFRAIDLYTTYGAALAALTWTASQDAGGTAISTAVAVDATTGTLLFTFSGSGWTGLATGATMTLYSPSVSAMAATVPLFGNASIQFTKP